MCVFKKFPQKLLRYDTKLVLRSIKKQLFCVQRGNSITEEGHLIPEKNSNIEICYDH